MAPEAPLGRHLDLEPQRSQPPSTRGLQRPGKHQEYHDATTEAGFQWSKLSVFPCSPSFLGEILQPSIQPPFFFHVFHGFDTGWVSSKRRLEDLAADAGPKAPPSPAREPRGSLASPARWSERLDVNTKRLAKILRSCAMDESSDSS